MKVVQVNTTGGPSSLVYTDAPKPSPAPGEVLVRARACGVGRADALIRRGVYHWMPPLPANPGNELAGEIAALGEGVRNFALGDKVYVNARDLPQRGGCYAEFVSVPTDVPHRLPVGVDLEQAAALGNYQVGWALLHEAAGPRMPESILVIGAAGGIASALIQLAKSAGVEVIGVVSNPTKAEFAARMGADRLIDYRTEDVFERTMALTAQRGVDVIFDHACGPDFPRYPSMLAKWGTLVSYNAFTPLPEQDLLSTLRASVDKCPAVRCFSFHVYDTDTAARRRITVDLIARLANGSILPAIGARLPMREARTAHELMDAGQTLGKILLIPPE